MEFDFVLRFRVPLSDWDPSQLVERLGDAGCTDANIGVGVPGRLALDFSREADTASDAIESAIAAVESAISSAELYEAAPDLVGMPGIAQVANVSRQAIQKVVAAHRDTFPLPLHEGAAPVWRLAEVLVWLKSRDMLRVDARAISVAKATMELNTARWLSSASPINSVRQARAISGFSRHRRTFGEFDAADMLASAARDYDLAVDSTADEPSGVPTHEIKVRLLTKPQVWSH